MTKVKELMQGATWQTAQGFEKLHPEISILLPTFRRGNNGLFQQCVDSLLDQTFKNFELIIIDDASYDQTASLINGYMKKDVRIACIRHAKNIGLTALSTFEGYIKSRAKKIFHAFDDNEYKRDALQKNYDLHASSPEILISYSIAKAITKSEKEYFGQQDFKYNNLAVANYIPHGGIMIDKQVFEDVGWYDPHICMTRLNDWDLWLRAGKKYKFHKINKCLSTEKGLSQTDSLANSHHLDMQLVAEWRHTARNEQLKPKNFLEYDISNIPQTLSQLSKIKIASLLKKKFPQFTENCTSADIFNQNDAMDGYIILFGEYEASTELYFTSLPEKLREKIIILPNIAYYQLNYFDLFLNARCIIFSRLIREQYITLANTLLNIGIPYYYYTDDNFFVLGIDKSTIEQKNFVKDAKGVLVSTKTLQEFFENMTGKKNVDTISPAIHQKSLDKNKVNLSCFDDCNDGLNIMLASADRLDGFCNLRDDIKALSEKYPLNLYIFQVGAYRLLEKVFNFENVKFHYLNYECCHETFVDVIRSKTIHFFLHPANPHKTFAANYKYKTLHFLINAYLTSSFVMLPDVLPYSTLKEHSALKHLVVPNGESWAEACQKLLTDAVLRTEVFTAIEDFCLREFYPGKNVPLFEKLLKENPAVDSLEFGQRLNLSNWYNLKIIDTLINKE